MAHEETRGEGWVSGLLRDIREGLVGGAPPDRLRALVGPRRAAAWMANKKPAQGAFSALEITTLWLRIKRLAIGAPFLVICLWVLYGGIFPSRGSPRDIPIPALIILPFALLFTWVGWATAVDEARSRLDAAARESAPQARRRESRSGRVTDPRRPNRHVTSGECPRCGAAHDRLVCYQQGGISDSRYRCRECRADVIYLPKTGEWIWYSEESGGAQPAEARKGCPCGADKGLNSRGYCPNCACVRCGFHAPYDNGRLCSNCGWSEPA